MTKQESGELASHLAACTVCREALQELEVADLRASRVLSLLDVEPDLAEAARRFQARKRIRDHGVDHPVKGGKRAMAGDRIGWNLRPVSLRRAAIVVLLLSGATVSALPGSPVRRWLTDGWEALTSRSVTPAATEALQDRPSPEAPGAPVPNLEAGAGIPTDEGPLEIWIHAMSRQAELRVLWVEGEEAWIYAGEGTRFTRSEGRLEAYDPPGAVRVEVPRNAASVTVGIDGRILVRKAGGELEIQGPVEERTPSEIRFGPARPPNAGGG